MTPKLFDVPLPDIPLIAGVIFLLVSGLGLVSTFGYVCILYVPMTMIFAIAHQKALESTKFMHEIGGILALDILI